MKRKFIVGIILMLLITSILAGCDLEKAEENNSDAASGNVVITETGETITKNSDSEEQKTVITLPDGTTVTDFGELPDPDVVQDVEATEPEIDQVDGDIDTTVSDDDGRLQLVFLGDSNFDFYRDGTGIPYLTGEQLDAKVVNLAMGGTCASIEIDEAYDNEHWTSSSFVGVVKAITGETTTEPFQGTRAQEIIDSGEVDFSKTDYFIIQYGINDFFKITPFNNQESYFDFRTYVGAMRYGIITLKDIAPDATIIVCSPNWSQFWSGNVFLGDGNGYNTGYGTLAEYVGQCNYVANEQQVEYMDCYLSLGIDAYTADEYLEDGVHLTEAGRHLFADTLANRIATIEETKNN